MKKECLRCGNKRGFWKLNDGRLKCENCKLKFALKNKKVKINREVLRRIVAEFVLEHSTNMILERVKVSKRKLLETLTLLRMKMTKDIPEVFEGIVEVDETYLGGQWKNKRLNIKKRGEKSKRGRGTTKQPVFGILCSDMWRGYTGIAARGYVHRMVEHGKGEYSDKKGNHINGLEGFWGYLKRKLSAKGGIRREKLPLFLGEYV